MRRLCFALLLVVGLAAPAWAATPGLVTRKLGDTNAGNTEVACGPNNKCTLVTPQPTKANNLLILWLVHDFSAGRTVTITDNQSNTWTLAATGSNSGAGLDLRAYYVCGVAAGTSVVTVNFDAP